MQALGRAFGDVLGRTITSRKEWLGFRLVLVNVVAMVAGVTPEEMMGDAWWLGVFNVATFLLLIAQSFIDIRHGSPSDGTADPLLPTAIARDSLPPALGGGVQISGATVSTNPMGVKNPPEEMPE